MEDGGGRDHSWDRRKGKWGTDPADGRQTTSETGVRGALQETRFVGTANQPISRVDQILSCISHMGRRHCAKEFSMSHIFD